ncbi:MAG: ABC transporter permease subunit [Thermoleophilia bacterium]|nr:ABC transporter permease subunit [Thermoleophilia bacterium]
MFSRPIFWQAVRSSYVLWVVCTVVLTAMLSLISAFHDPVALSGFMEAIEDTAVAAEAGEELDLFSTLLGMLTQTIYGFAGIMITMVYVVVTANSLVASEVDRGSMAYTLSTPTKRTTVVFTKALYLIISVVLMFAIIATAGILTIQFKHHAVWGTHYTKDAQAAAKVLGLDEEEVAGNLSLIMHDAGALRAGADARGLDLEVYSAYLLQAMARDVYAATAEILGVEQDEVEAAPTLIQNDPKALEAAAAIMGMDTETCSAYIDEIARQTEEMAPQEEALKTALTNGLSAGAKQLGMEMGALATELDVLKDDAGALAAAREASGLDEATFNMALNQAIAANAILADKGVEFDALDFLMMNLGILLLMFAVSGISFLASCIFNLSKHSLALGAGLPFAFLVIFLLSGVNETLEPLKYFSLMTLFDSERIVGEDPYWVQFVMLGVIGIVLYVFAIRVFKRKDLPL